MKKKNSIVMLLSLLFPLTSCHYTDDPSSTKSKPVTQIGDCNKEACSCKNSCACSSKCPCSCNS